MMKKLGQLLSGVVAYAALLAAFGCLAWLSVVLDHGKPIRRHWGQVSPAVVSPAPEGKREAVEEAAKGGEVEGVPERRREEVVEEVPLVVVDAGHGGGDGGAVANGITEKTLALALAGLVREELLKQGLRVEMTRETDTYLTLEQRAAVANRAGAAAFVSVHLNSVARGYSIHGIETYYSTRKTLPAMRAVQKAFQLPTMIGLKDRRGERLAAVVQRMVCQSTGGANRGIRERELTVVHGSACPAILVECGFISNAAEAKRLLDPSYQRKLALGVARGVSTFLHIQDLDPMRGIELPPPMEATQVPLDD